MTAAHEASSKVISETSAPVAIPGLLRRTSREWLQRNAKRPRRSESESVAGTG
jgi:hypothetical protein